MVQRPDANSAFVVVWTGNKSRTPIPSSADSTWGMAFPVRGDHRRIDMGAMKAELHRLVDRLPDDALDGTGNGRAVPGSEIMLTFRDLSRIMAILTGMAKDLASRQAPLGDPGERSLDIFRS
jgi:hypothetical protein